MRCGNLYISLAPIYYCNICVEVMDHIKHVLHKFAIDCTLNHILDHNGGENTNGVHRVKYGITNN